MAILTSSLTLDPILALPGATPGDDTLTGTLASEFIEGLAGNDKIYGRNAFWAAPATT